MGVGVCGKSSSLERRYTPQARVISPRRASRIHLARTPRDWRCNRSSPACLAAPVANHLRQLSYVVQAGWSLGRSMLANGLAPRPRGSPIGGRVVGDDGAPGGGVGVQGRGTGVESGMTGGRGGQGTASPASTPVQRSWSTATDPLTSTNGMPSGGNIGSSKFARSMTLSASNTTRSAK